MSLQSQFSVVVPAAGVGKRMQTHCPKQYLKIADKTVIEHTLQNLLAHPNIGQIVVVLNPRDNQFSQLDIAKHAKISTVIGGEQRYDSVLAGLNYLDPAEQWVLVHDAARPCLEHSDLSALLKLAVKGGSGGILATPVRDTMKRAISQTQVVKHTEPRADLWHALTPQFFNLAKLKAALQNALHDNAAITDEASAMELAGETVNLVAGKASNIKITQPEDLLLAEFYLTQAKSWQPKESNK